jgi:predicted pyridoxine 5'-phosphate oxidase superfamily flavin-nucleotide-binding protein
MSQNFVDLMSTPCVQAAQLANGSRKLWSRVGSEHAADRLTDREIEFITSRDSFYLASMSESGWPYVQHRGGPKGFLAALDDQTLGFADFRGNRQYISLGNVAADDRVALILMDYPTQTRLKILAHMTERDLASDPDLAARLATPGYRGKPERAFVLRLQAFDWNCQQHIMPRFTPAQIETAVAPLRARLAALEAENATLKAAPESVQTPG